MKVYFEIEDGWLDEESPILWASGTIREQAQRALVEAFTKQLLKKTKVPTIKITAKELKNRMLTILAEKALEEQEGR